MAVIRICLKPGESAGASAFRAMADEVAAEFRNDNRVEVSEAAISVDLGIIDVTTRPNQIRRSITRIEPILRRHRLDSACDIITET